MKNIPNGNVGHGFFVAGLAGLHALTAGLAVLFVALFCQKYAFLLVAR